MIMVLKFEDYINEGLINKTLKRVRTGTDRLEVTKTPLEKIRDEIEKFLKELVKNNEMDSVKVELESKKSIIALNEKYVMTIHFSKYEWEVHMYIREDDDMKGVAYEVCDAIYGFMFIDTPTRTNKKQKDVARQIITMLSDEYELDYKLYEGLINKTLKRVRNNEDRIEDKEPPIKRVCNHIKDELTRLAKIRNDIYNVYIIEDDLFQDNHKYHIEFFMYTDCMLYIHPTITNSHDETVVAKDIYKNFYELHKETLDNKNISQKYVDRLSSIIEYLEKTYNLEPLTEGLINKTLKRVRTGEKRTEDVNKFDRWLKSAKYDEVKIGDRVWLSVAFGEMDGNELASGEYLTPAEVMDLKESLPDGYRIANTKDFESLFRFCDKNAATIITYKSQGVKAHVFKCGDSALKLPIVGFECDGEIDKLYALYPQYYYVSENHGVCYVTVPPTPSCSVRRVNIEAERHALPIRIIKEF